MLRAILNKSWWQHPTRHQLYGHLPPITKSIQFRRARHAGHSWRIRDELISDVLLWTTTYGRAKAGLPPRTYIQQLCEDMGCIPEDLPEAMNDREKWRKSFRYIRASGTTWWWWWWWCIPASMVLFSAAITRDNTFSLKISVSKPWPSFPVCDFACFTLEISIQLFFLPIFCFLFLFVLLILVFLVLFLVAVIRRPLRFFSCLRVVLMLSWMMASPLLPSFLGTYSLSISSLGCNALCIVMSFLVLWSICWSSSFVHSKNGPGYLTRWVLQAFTLLMSYFIHRLVSSNFHVLQRYYFKNFLSPSLVWGCSLLIFPGTCKFPLISKYSFKVFHISVSWWLFTGVWVTASLLKSPGLFSVFWPSSIMMSFGWFPLVCQLPNPPGPLIIL